MGGDIGKVMSEGTLLSFTQKTGQSGINQSDNESLGVAEMMLWGKGQGAHRKKLGRLTVHGTNTSH